MTSISAGSSAGAGAPRAPRAPRASSVGAASGGEAQEGQPGVNLGGDRPKTALYLLFGLGVANFVFGAYSWLAKPASEQSPAELLLETISMTGGIWLFRCAEALRKFQEGYPASSQHAQQGGIERGERGERGADAPPV